MHSYLSLHLHQHTWPLRPPPVHMFIYIFIYSYLYMYVYICRYIYIHIYILTSRPRPPPTSDPLAIVPHCRNPRPHRSYFRPPSRPLHSSRRDAVPRRHNSHRSPRGRVFCFYLLLRSTIYIYIYLYIDI